MNARRGGSLRVRLGVGEDGADQVDDTVADGDVGADDLGGRVTGHDVGAGRVGHERHGSAAGRRDVANRAELGRVGDGAVEDVAVKGVRRRQYAEE